MPKGIVKIVGPTDKEAKKFLDSAGTIALQELEIPIPHTDEVVVAIYLFCADSWILEDCQRIIPGAVVHPLGRYPIFLVPEGLSLQIVTEKLLESGYEVVDD